MSIGLRIKELRKSFKINQKAFSTELQVDNSQMSKIESDKIQPTIPQLIAISSFFEVSVDWLLKGDVEKYSITEDSVTRDFDHNLKKPNSSMPKVVTIDSDGRNNIALVPVKASAGYLLGYEDPSFVNDLPVYNLPNMKDSTFRMFEVDGHSMYPTLHDCSIVIGEWVEYWSEDIKDDRVYIIVSKNDGVIVKRVLNRLDKYGSLYCKSDNRREYPNLSINKEDILEVWSVKMNLNFELPNPSDLYDRMNDLEAELFHIKQNRFE